MKVTYAFQGMVFAICLAGIAFLLNLTCPVNAETWCFSEHLVSLFFMPSFFFGLFYENLPQIIAWEPILLLAYWGALGFLVGLCFDLLYK